MVYTTHGILGGMVYCFNHITPIVALEPMDWSPRLVRIPMGSSKRKGGPEPGESTGWMMDVDSAIKMMIIYMVIHVIDIHILYIYTHTCI